MATGPVAQADLTTQAAFPATIPASGSYTAGPLYADGYKVIAVGATLANAGTLFVQRYLDTAGLVPQGPALQATLAANAPGILNVADGAPFQSFTVTVTNSTASAAALTNTALLLNAA